ncbi:hypothetical protein DAPPUDRAFT_219079 [Daphnia pulex]|uniref:Endocuticle structural glycoprotein SgAbd-2 n=1 Tax=Daphnia pulex TaxID=6669 RepID=E9HPM1_DAPPU|nr:hypothetical protein DAPPUDRAFT_219079 [Daphnia pulex]|eukprot:EFX66318.1 hypothetical protein DAPPUDRAFT_219079 [Daphnia pulex]
MQYVALLSFFVAVAIAAPLTPVENAGDAAVTETIMTTTTPIPIVRQEMTVENGTHKNSFETGHGIVVEESGSQKQVGILPEESGAISSGSYSYTNPDGSVITVTWVADENGFKASGDHLPTPPPMPEHVIKMLADIEAARLEAAAAAPPTTEAAPSL